jgi:hypothetical protein
VEHHLSRDGSGTLKTNIFCANFLKENKKRKEEEEKKK